MAITWFNKKKYFVSLVLDDCANNVYTFVLWFISLILLLCWTALSVTWYYVYYIHGMIIWCDRNLDFKAMHMNMSTERLRKLHYLRRLLDTIIYLWSFSSSCEHNHVYILLWWKWLLIVIKVEMSIHNGFLILPLTVILELYVLH